MAFISIPASHCLLHEDSMVELQTLIHSQQQQGYRSVCVHVCGCFL